jgi:hypothetical protein
LLPSHSANRRALETVIKDLKDDISFGLFS